MDDVYAEAVNLERGIVDCYHYPPGWPPFGPLPPARRYLTCARRKPGLWFFRVLGFGLHCKDLTRHPLLFFERDGRRWGLRLGRWRIRPLVPWH